MNRLIVALAASILLTCGAAARGQWNKYDPAAKKLMPKDQLEIVERMEDLAEKHKTLLSRIKDAKKRGEENERIGAEQRRIQEEIAKKQQTEGLTGWVGVCHIVMPNNAVVLDSVQPLYMNMKLSDKGKPIGAAEQALRAIKPNDIVRFSTKPDPSYRLPAPLGKTFGAVGQPVPFTSLASVEKVGVRSTKPPAKAPPARRKSR